MNAIGNQTLAARVDAGPQSISEQLRILVDSLDGNPEEVEFAVAQAEVLAHVLEGISATQNLHHLETLLTHCTTPSGVARIVRLISPSDYDDVLRGLEER